MTTNHPVAIIGAGIGGLTAALALMRNGIPCIVFEASNRIGGCCATLEYEECVFEPAASVIIGASLLADILKPLDVEINHLLSLIQPIVRLKARDYSFDLRGPTETFLESLKGWACSDVTNARKFIERGVGVARSILHDLWEWKMERKIRWSALRRLGPLLATSYGSLVRQYLSNTRLQNMFAAFSDFYAGISADVAPGILCILPALSIEDGCYEIRGGIQRLPEHLAQVLTASGVEIRLNEPVQKMVLDDSRVCSLITPSAVIPVRGVVAACDIRIAWKLLEGIPRLGMARLYTSLLRPSASCISMGGMEPNNSTQPAATWIYSNYLSELRTSNHGSRGCRLLPLAAVMRGSSSGAKRPIRIGGAIAHSKQGNAVDIKELSEVLLHMADIAGLDVTLERNHVWGPTQYEHHLGLPGGAAFGFAASRFQLGPFRYGPRTPISNVMVAGQSCFPGFGIPFVAFSGRLAAETIMEVLGKK